MHPMSQGVSIKKVISVGSWELLSSLLNKINSLFTGQSPAIVKTWIVQPFHASKISLKKKTLKRERRSRTLLELDEKSNKSKRL